MAALTKVQVEHAMLRLSQQRAAYISKRTAHLGPRPKEPELTNEDKFAMITAGTAVLRPNISKHYQVLSAFDYPLNNEQRAAEAAHDVWRSQYDEVSAEAETIYQSVLDELIMSPDGKAALDRIVAAFV